MKARVTVMLKNGVLDPQGEAVRHALGTLGFSGVSGVRQGKVIELDLDGSDRAKAEADAGEEPKKDPFHGPVDGEALPENNDPAGHSDGAAGVSD